MAGVLHSRVACREGGSITFNVYKMDFLMTHFMKPHFFDQTQKDAIEKRLEQLKIGDEEGRRIFILAMEYELAEYEEELPDETEKTIQSTPDENLVEIASAADTLSLLLKGLSNKVGEGLTDRLASGDRFSRQYDEKYLAALVTELERLSSACHVGSENAPLTQPGLSKSANSLIAMIAEAYAECFEVDPLPGEDQPFARLLDEILRISGLEMQVTESALRAILNT